MTIWYLTSLTYPSTLANRLQVIKMTEAFSRHTDIMLWVASMGSKRKEVLESYGVKEDLTIKELPTVSGMLWPKSFFRALTFRRVVHQAPPEVVFYTRDVLLTFFLTLLSPRFRANFFFECHSLGKFSKIIYKKVLQSARGIVSTNKAKAEVIGLVYGVDAERICVAPNGFDASLFDALPSRAEARTVLKLPHDQSIVLYAGSLSPWKGIDVMYALAKSLPQILFIVLGAREEKKENNLWVLPAVSNHIVPQYLRAADILIAPYRADSERAQLYFSPIKIMEYVASGTPVVATRLAAIEELPGSFAITFADRYKVDDFHNAINIILGRYEEYDARARDACGAIEVLDWKSRADQIIVFMQKTL